MKKLTNSFSYLVISILSVLPTLALGSDYIPPFFSEENNGKFTCLNNEALTGLSCKGRYCDNLALKCGGKAEKITRHWWTKAISEERSGTSVMINGILVRHNDNMQRCDLDGYIIGLACKGAYCDNLSLHCAAYQNHQPTDCAWTNWVSEEHGGQLVLPKGKMAVSMECKGAYCDNKRFFACF